MLSLTPPTLRCLAEGVWMERSIGPRGRSFSKPVENWAGANRGVQKRPRGLSWWRGGSSMPWGRCGVVATRVSRSCWLGVAIGGASLAGFREYEAKSIAFPAISTGIYHFPKGPAAEIAVRECREHADGAGWRWWSLFVSMRLQRWCMRGCWARPDQSPGMWADVVSQCASR